MPNNLLLFPLLAGYLFINRTLYFRYRGETLDGYRLLFEAAIWGIFITAPARLITYSLHFIPGLDLYWNTWYEISSYPFIGTGALALCIGYLLPIPINRFWMNAADSKDAALENSADPLSLLLNDAVSRNFPIALSLKSRKFYVGFVMEAPIINALHRNISLLPVASGYRDKDTLRFCMTTDYLKAHRLSKLDPNDFKIVIPVDEIQTANLFDMEVYAAIFHKPVSLEISN